MADKTNEQIKLEVQEWQLSNTFVGIFGLLAPAACLAIILGHSGAFFDFMLNTDHSHPKVPPHAFHRWLTSLLLWPFRQGPTFQDPISSKKHRKKLTDTRNPQHVWRDGSLLCTTVNMVIPGACKDPREHWMCTPKHGVQLVKDYFDIESFFTEDDFNHPLNPFQEKKFSKYLHQVNNIVSKQLEAFNNMRFSTDYVARGMGLVIGEQHRKSTFYVYPVPKKNNQPCELEVYIKGPNGQNGHIVIPSILHHKQRCQQPTEYKRALYMSSKLNSISPTISGTSFLRRLSLTTPKLPDPNLEIDIRVKISSTRAKVSYTPQKNGVYEIRLVTKDCHVVGSPYSIPIETLSSSNYLSNSNSESEDENEGKYIKRKKRIISRIVDFIDEKMMLQNDGTLTKIQEKNIDPNNIECNQKNEQFCENTSKLKKQQNIQQKSEDEDMKIAEIKTNNENISLKQCAKEKQNICNRENKLDKNNEFVKTKLNEHEDNTRFSLNYFEAKNLEKCISQTVPVEEIKKKFELNESKEKLKACENKIKLNKQPNIQHISEDEVMKIVEIKTNNENIIFPKQEAKDKQSVSNRDNKLDKNNEFVKTKLNENNIHQYEDTTKFSLNYFKPTNLENYIFKTVPIENIKKKYESNESKEILKACENILQNNTNIDIILPNKTNENLKTNQVSSYLENKEENNNKIFDFPNPTSPESTLHINDRIPDISKYFAPDILEKSASFTKPINVEVILEPEPIPVDPTLVKEVIDPTLDFSNRKTFSNKDPSKKTITSSTLNSTTLVNNIVKVFNSQEPIKKTDVSLKTSPDLVQCHIQRTSESSKQNNTVNKKLKSMGAILDDYDHHQCYLKDCLQNNLEEYFKLKIDQTSEGNITTEKTFEMQTYKTGLVDKKKQFWNEKISTKPTFDFNSTKPKILLKNSFITETKEESKQSIHFKPFEGIVRNKRQIFEKQISAERIYKAQNYKTNLQKSKSETFVQKTTEETIYYKQDSISDDEIIEIPTIEERKNKFLQACQQSYTSPEKEIKIVTPKIVVEQENTQKIEIKVPQKQKKHSFRRKARFKRAKLFFHHLEGSDPKLTTDSLPTPVEQKLSRSESDSCVSYSKSLSISDRFQVDDLYQDILGDDKRFIGIPNKMAVVASLASLDSDSSRAEFESEGEMTLENFEGKPKRIRRKKIPGYQEEFPYVPTTNRWQYKTRNTEELIPGRTLLSKTETD